MKIKILKEILQGALSIFSRIVGKNTNLPILSNILLDARDSFLSISATNLEIGMENRVLSKIEKPGKITIPLGIFFNIVSALPSKPITLEVKNNSLFVVMDGFSSEIKGLSAEDFPIIPTTSKNNGVVLPSRVFCDALGQVCDLTSQSSVRPEISGVLVSFFEKSFVLAATDSFRLAEKSVLLGGATGLTEGISFILPQRSAKEIVGVFGGKEDGEQKLKIVIDQGQVFVDSLFSNSSQEGIYLTSKLIDGEYPNYKEIIPKTPETQIVLDRGEFLSQIKLASLFTGRTEEVRLGIDDKNGGIKINSQNRDLGEHTSFLTGKVKGKSAEVSFNCRFLIDGVSKIKSSEMALWLTRRNGDLGPGVLMPVGDQSYLYVLMPLSVS